MAVTPRGPRARQAIERLPFVAAVEDDQPRYLADVGSWDRDILEVVDVQESGTVGDPDPREVEETGAGVHVVVIDTGLIKNWRTFLPSQSVRTDLARAFMSGGATADDFVPVDEFHTSNPTHLWERDTSSHGTAVTSHVTGFKIGADSWTASPPERKSSPSKSSPTDKRSLSARGLSPPLPTRPSLRKAASGLLKATALPLAADDGRLNVLDPFLVGGFFDPQWNSDCDGEPCDPVGAGLLQADAALAATP